MTDPLRPSLQNRLASRLPSFLKWALILAPALWIIAMLRARLVNVPFMDDYVWLPFYEKIVKHEFRFSDFFFVQMEHRLTLPCFLAWLMYHLKPGQFTLLNWLSYAQMALTAFNLCWLIRRTSPAPRWNWVLMALTTWIVFSPTQFSTMLWADCFSSFMPTTLLTTTLVLFHSKLRPVLKFIVCVLTAILCTHSFASGVLIWVLMVPLFLWSDVLDSVKTRRLYIGGWMIICVVVMALYFHGLTNQAEPEFSYQQGREETLTKHLSAFLSHPLASSQFSLMFAGSLLGRGSFTDLKDATLGMGLFLTAVVIGAAVIGLRNFKDKPLLSRLLPWIILGLYTLATGAMVAMGRIWASLNFDGALWNRYTTHAVPLTLAAAMLIFIIAHEFWQRREDWRNALIFGQAGLLGGFIAVLLAGWSYGFQHAEMWWSSRLRDATSQLFARVLPYKQMQGPVTGNLKFAQRMDDIGLLKPKMLRTLRLDNFQINHKMLSEHTAAMDDIQKFPGAVLQAQGHAYMPGQARVADGVLLTYKDDKEDWIIFYLAQVSQAPLYLRNVLSVDSQFIHQPFKSVHKGYAFFTANFDATMLPDRDCEIAAWTVDFKRNSVSPMGDRFRWKANREKAVEVLHTDEKSAKK